jgi:hypothetical protein
METIKTFASLRDFGARFAENDDKHSENVQSSVLWLKGQPTYAVGMTRKTHPDTFSELEAGFLSTWGQNKFKPRTYIVLEEGQGANFVPETIDNAKAKGERFTLSADYVMAQSQQLFGKFKTATADASVMPKAWQAAYHAIAVDVRKAFSNYKTEKFRKLERAIEDSEPKLPRARGAVKDTVVKVEETFGDMLKSCKVAKSNRNDETAHPERMALAQRIFLDIYKSRVPMDTVSKEWDKVWVKLTKV